MIPWVTKRGIENGVRERFQERMNSDAAYREYSIEVSRVTLIKSSPYTYDGIVTVSLDHDHSRTYEVPISVTADKSNFIWELKPGAFDFLKGIVYIPMAFVKGGTFTMGNTGEQGGDSYDDEKPAHSVTVSDFYAGKYPVTQKQWAAVMGSNPSIFKGDDLPVEHVTWNDVRNFITKLNAATGKKYRLLTEAEWEYAARGGAQSGGFKYAGSDIVDEVAWYKGNSNGKTQPVGAKKPNELGIYDMNGNVLEWVGDWYEGYTVEPKTDPQGPPEDTGSHVRALRGGCWCDIARFCRVTFRFNAAPDFRFYNIGFRLALPAGK